MTNWKDLISTSLKRAKRKPQKGVLDEIDKFVWLWIAFNGWMKSKYEISYPRECQMINQVKQLKEMESVYTQLKEDNNQRFNENLNKLKNYSFPDRRPRNNEGKTIQYDGTFPSLIEFIYQVRCNLFHGRKDTSAPKEKERVSLAYKILLPIFTEYLKQHGYA